MPDSLPIVNKNDKRILTHIPVNLEQVYLTMRQRIAEVYEIHQAFSKTTQEVHRLHSLFWGELATSNERFETLVSRKKEAIIGQTEAGKLVVIEVPLQSL